jgi:hypothetical protein
VQRDRSCGRRALSWLHGFPPESIKDRLLLWTAVKFLNVLITYLLREGGKARAPFLSWVLALSEPSCMEAETCGVLSVPNCRIDLRVRTWSPSLGEDMDPVIGFGKVSLVYAFRFRRDVCLGYLARIHRFTNRRFF